jgi:hypothetical protein
MEVCPICRASLAGASTCRRCRAELQTVQEVERRGQALAGAAMLALAEGDLDGATYWLDRARAVHATPVVRGLRRLMVDPQLPDDQVDENEHEEAERARPLYASPEPADAHAGQSAPTAPASAQSDGTTPSWRPLGQLPGDRLRLASTSLLAVISKDPQNALKRMARWLRSMAGFRGLPERRASQIDQRPHPGSNFLGQDHG